MTCPYAKPDCIPGTRCATCPAWQAALASRTPPQSEGIEALKAKYVATGTDVMQTILLTSLFNEAIDQARAITLAECGGVREAAIRECAALFACNCAVPFVGEHTIQCRALHKAEILRLLATKASRDQKHSLDSAINALSPFGALVARMPPADFDVMIAELGRLVALAKTEFAGVCEAAENLGKIVAEFPDQPEIWGETMEALWRALALLSPSPAQGDAK